MPPLPHLPLGQQSFEVLRNEQAVYVDKTPFIHRLVSQGRFYFLSRPRRFGKSLLVSTLKCLFEGKQELFEGLWISKDNRWNWEPHPIIVIDFNNISHDTPAHFEQGLLQYLRKLAEQYGISLQTAFYKEGFVNLILGLYQKTGRSVVVLIDEYDKPIIDHLGVGLQSMETARTNRDILRQFLGALKGQSVVDCLRFVFLTGISKFSRVSLFSELNNLSDLTMSKPYAELCGYTESELKGYFSGHLEALRQELDVSLEQLHEQLAARYNGYRFTSKAVSVYNPFSILSVFNDLEMKSYWFESGSPSFLVNLIHGGDLPQRQFDLPQMDALFLEAEQFSTYNLERLNLAALLFQTGYITIKDYDGTYFTLGYPNQEVQKGFINSLWETYSGISNGTPLNHHLLTTLKNQHWEAFFEGIQATFAQIPYTLNAKRDEAYFHTAFYLLLSRLGLSPRNEVLTHRGRIDMVIEFPSDIFIFEFKCNQSAEEALQQIKTQGYATPYQATGKSITLIGIDFSTDSRNITDWRVEPYLPS